MRICTTCGEVYSEGTVACHAHGKGLRDWTEVTDTAADPIGDIPDPAFAVTAHDPGDSPDEESDFERAPTGLSGDVWRTLGGRYRLGKQIGIGGYGAVFDAYDARLQKRVAVKVLSPAVSDDVEVMARFRQEAIAASQIRHEAIVDVTDFNVDPGGIHFIVMQFLDGVDLSDVLAHQTRLPPSRALAIAAQCADALAAAHDVHILHRDLKPANIFLISTKRRDDIVKIIDFGISKITPRDGSRDEITSSSHVVGTPFYMPPEQAEGDILDARADIYALGVIMFEMLTGQRPFVGRSTLEILTNHRTQARTPPSALRPELAAHPGLDELVLRAIAVRPERRQPSMAALGDELIACLANVDPNAVAALHSTTTSSMPLPAQPEPPLELGRVKPSTLDASSGEVTRTRMERPSTWWRAGVVAAACAVFTVWAWPRGDSPAQRDATPNHARPATTQPAPAMQPAPTTEDTGPRHQAAQQTGADVVELAPTAKPASTDAANAANTAKPARREADVSRKTKPERKRSAPRKRSERKKHSRRNATIGIKDW